MRSIIFSVLLLASGCASTTISSIPYKEDSDTKGIDGVPYMLPKGLVPVQVFADSNGIGITIEPARSVSDSNSGKLIARVQLNPFNKEDVKIAVDPATGFLTSITTNSESQVLQIVEEAAKSAARLALQNGRAAFFENKVVLMEDTFDPLSPLDVRRINEGLNDAIRRATPAFRAASQTRLTIDDVLISVVQVDGKPLPRQVPQVVDLGKCAVGVCVRTRTSLRVQLEVGRQALASKVINVPAAEVVALPMPSTALANQDITVAMVDGVLDKYDIKRDSEILTVVKIPGAIVAGVITGLTDGLKGEKSVIDARKDVAASEEALATAKKKRNEAVESLGEASVNLQSGIVDGGGARNSFESQTLTIYPFSETLTRAIDSAIEREKAKSSPPGPGVDGGLTIPPDGDLLEAPSTAISPETR